MKANFHSMVISITKYRKDSCIIMHAHSTRVCSYMRYIMCVFRILSEQVQSEISIEAGNIIRKRAVIVYKLYTRLIKTEGECVIVSRDVFFVFGDSVKRP